MRFWYFCVTRVVASDHLTLRDQAFDVFHDSHGRVYEIAYANGRIVNPASELFTEVDTTFYLDYVKSCRLEQHTPLIIEREFPLDQLSGKRYIAFLQWQGQVRMNLAQSSIALAPTMKSLQGHRALS